MSVRASSVLVLIGINRRVVDVRFWRVSRWCKSVVDVEGCESRGLDHAKQFEAGCHCRHVRAHMRLT